LLCGGTTTGITLVTLGLSREGRSVGFWGTFIVARSSRPVMELDGLTALVDRVVGQHAGGDGCQVVQLHRWPEEWNASPSPAGWEAVLVAVMEQTGQPVLAGTVFDSDGAQLIGYGPKAGRWGGWLMLERIMGYLDRAAVGYAYEDDNGDTQVEEVDDQTLREIRDRLYGICPPAHIAAPLAVRWASEAGLTADSSRVEAVLGGHATFAEDLFYRLLTVLGLPGMADAEY